MSSLRLWLNKYAGIPLMLLLRGWVLNDIIARIPLPELRYAYYRAVCGMKIHKTSALWRGAQFTGDKLDEINIGPHCVIGYSSFWVACAPIILLNDVVIGHRVEFYTTDHDPDDPEFLQRVAPIKLEDHVWVGSRAMILKGVTIGRGAVVAAGSVVTKDVEPFTIVGGNPARVIRKRQTTEFTYRSEGSPPFS